MKQISFLFALFGALTTVNAQGKETCFLDGDSSLKIGGTYSYVCFTPSTILIPQEGNPPIKESFDSFKGNLAGVQGIYEYSQDNSLYAGTKLSWKQGNMKDKKGSRFLVDIDVLERIGYTLALKNTPLKISFFTGFGYRCLKHTLSQPGHNDLEFKYKEFYVPVGVITNFCVNSSFEIGINAIWMPQIFPTLALRPHGGTNWQIEKTFANTTIEIPLLYKPSCCTHFSVALKPFFQYWQDGQSVAKLPGSLSLGVPKNTYLFSGAELNLCWNF